MDQLPPHPLSADAFGQPAQESFNVQQPATDPPIQNDKEPVQPVQGAAELEDAAIYDDESEPIEHVLGFKEYEKHIIKGNVDLELVTRRRRPFKITLCLIPSDGVQMMVFETNMWIRLAITPENMPTFSIYETINPNKSAHSSDFRKYAIDFEDQIPTILTEANGMSFEFTIENPQGLTESRNDDAPATIGAGPFESFMSKNKPDASVIWRIFADVSNQQHVITWGVAYWFRELDMCRRDIVHRLRQWVTEFGTLLLTEDEAQRVAVNEHNVQITLSPAGEGLDGLVKFTFTRPDDFHVGPNRIIQVSADSGIWSDNPPPPMLRLKRSPLVEEGRQPWVALVREIHPVTGVVECLILHKFAADSPTGTHSVDLRIYYSDGETIKSLLARSHIYFKCISQHAARLESQSTKHADKAGLRHSINFVPLILHDVQLPDRTVMMQNSRRELIPASLRPLNYEQLEVFEHAHQSANRVILINGPAGCGKTLILTKFLAWYFFKNLKGLATASMNRNVDRLLEKTLSTIQVERPGAAPTRLPNILRVVAPFRTMTSLLSKIGSAALGVEEDGASADLKIFNIDQQRLILARQQNNTESAEFLNLQGDLDRDGYFSDTDRAKRYLVLANHYDATLVERADIVFATNSMASQKQLVDKFMPAIHVTEESANTRKDHWFNSVVWYPGLELDVQGGDPLQTGPFVNGDRRSNGLATSLHQELVERDFVGVIQLVEQYRMEPELIVFPNMKCYDNKLRTAQSVLDGRPARNQLRAIIAEKPTTPSGAAIDDINKFFDVENGWSEDDASQSTKNAAEAILAVELAQTLLNNGVRRDQLRILTPYVAQVREINIKLAAANIAVEVCTIDSYIGDEADFVIISLTRANGKTGFLDDNARFLVASTRARFGRWFVGKHEFWATREEESHVQSFAITMQQLAKVSQVTVANAPAPPAAPAAFARVPREPRVRGERVRAPRPQRERPVPLPEVTYNEFAMSEAQAAAKKYYAIHDANA